MALIHFLKYLIKMCEKCLLMTELLIIVIHSDVVFQAFVYKLFFILLINTLLYLHYLSAG